MGKRAPRPGRLDLAEELLPQRLEEAEILLGRMKDAGLLGPRRRKKRQKRSLSPRVHIIVEDGDVTVIREEIDHGRRKRGQKAYDSGSYYGGDYYGSYNYASYGYGYGYGYGSYYGEYSTGLRRLLRQRIR